MTTRFEVTRGDVPETRCASGTMIYGEALYKQRFLSVIRSVTGRPRYQGGVDPMGISRIERFVGRFPLEAFELEIDGQSLHGHWELEDGGEIPCEEGSHGVMTLRHTVRPVRVKVHSQMDGTAFITRWLEIENLGDVPMAISRVSPMSGLLWLVDDRAEHGVTPQFEVGLMPDVPWGYEGSFELRPLLAGTTTMKSYNGRSGWGLPWFMARNLASGEAFVGHLEWSANWRMDFTVIEYPGSHETLLSFAAGPDGHGPLYMLAPGESLLSPVMHLGHMQGALQAVVAQTHTHLRNISRRVDEGNLLIGAARVVDGDMDWLEQEAGLAAKVGMEYFLVDAGWFCNPMEMWYDSTGDWQVTRFGGTLSGVRELIQSKGMKFGLWMEPESVGKASQMHKERPDFSIARDGQPAGGQGRLIDMSKPEVAAWVEEQLLKVFSEHQADLFKIDYNTFEIFEGGENLKDGYMENASWRYVKALYSIFDRVAEQYPDTLLENCAGGGGRNDAGLMKRFHVSCMSDYSMLPRSLKALNNLTLALPPERLRFYYGHLPNYHLYGDLDTQLRMLMFTNPLFVGFGRDENWLMPDEAERIHEYVSLYKSFCRSVLPTCKVYHHTPYLQFGGKDPFCVLEYGKPDRTQGYAAVFHLVDGTEVYMLYLRGVNPAKAYKVTRMNHPSPFIVPGEKLMQEGLRILLDGALTSEMVLYEEE